MLHVCVASLWLFSSLCAGVISAEPPGAEARSPRMNLVFILADDLGYHDTSLNGALSFHETPNIQRLADRGMVLTNAYSASPVCSPTRASILTGQEPGRLGITAAKGSKRPERPKAEFRTIDESAEPSSKSKSRKALVALSATLLPTGVSTLAEALRSEGYATGHFGKWHLGPEPHSPLEHGFDVDVPHWPNPIPSGSYLAPWGFPAELDFKPRVPFEHVEDRMASEAVAFMAKHKDEPFFLNYWAFSIHAPLEAKPELIEKYASMRPSGNRNENPIYAAMVQSFDDAVGTMLDGLDRLGLAERTIVVLFSDNGGSAYVRVKGVPIMSNSPLRGGKAEIYEGGTRVPAAVVWPGHIEARSHSAAFLTSTDWYPTLLEMLGAEKPAGHLVDGVSQVPAFQGQAAPRSSIHCFFPHYFSRPGTVPASSIRRGKWKLIRFHHDGEDQRDRFELYDLEADIGESKNLSREYPERVRVLNEGISSYLREIGALVPKRNPAYVPGFDGSTDLTPTASTSTGSTSTSSTPPGPSLP